MSASAPRQPIGEAAAARKSREVRKKTMRVSFRSN
jgi:hypothetical protein